MAPVIVTNASLDFLQVPTGTLKDILQKQTWATGNKWWEAPVIIPLIISSFPSSFSTFLFTVTCHSLWRETVYTHTPPLLPPQRHLTFLQLVIAHHDACNVTLVSRRQAAMLSLHPRPGETKTSIVSSEWEKMRKTGRGVSGYNQIQPLHHHRHRQHHHPKPVGSLSGEITVLQHVNKR